MDDENSETKNTILSIIIIIIITVIIHPFLVRTTS